MTDVANHPPFTPVAWTLAALVVAALPHLVAMPLWLSLLFLAAVAWRLAASRFAWSPPPGFLRIVLTLLALGLVVLAHGSQWSRRAAATLLCIMLAAKLMEMFRPRDLRLVAALGFFLMTAHFLFNERLAYLIYLLAGAWLATTALLEIQRHESASPDPTGSRRGGARVSLRRAGVLLGLSLPLAAAMFLFFPRLAEPLWGLPESAVEGRTGLSDEMTAGSIANLFLDNSPAFRAEFDDQPPSANERYWRGPVLSHLDGNTWRRPELADRPARSLVPGALDDNLNYRVQLEPHERRWLFALDHPVSGPDHASITASHEMLSRNRITSLTQYDAVSNPRFFDDRELGTRERLTTTSLPPQRNPRTREWAESLRETHPDDQDFVAEVLRWFGDEAFSYSLQTVPLGRNGADEFLFDIRNGYCEYYASAFAILMRAAGIPSRVVTGYQGGLWQPDAGYLLVRQSDAHAWNEVWLEDLGWIRVDPTAAVSPGRIEQGAREVIADRPALFDADWVVDLMNRYDRIQHLWNRWILGFDADRQQRLLERFGLRDVQPTHIAVAMIIALSLVILTMALVYWQLTRPRPDSQAQRVWFKLLRRLRRLGIQPQPSETPLRFAHRASHRLAAEQRDELIALAVQYQRIRYGPEAGSPLEEFVERIPGFRPRRGSA